MVHELIKDRPKFNSANTGDTYAHMLIYMLYVYSIYLGEVLEGIIFHQKFILTYHFFLSTQIKYTSHVNLSCL